MLYIVQVNAMDTWKHVATFDNEKGANDVYYHCLKSDTSRNYRILKQLVIKESNR